MKNKQEIKGLEQAVDEAAGSGWYRKEVDKFLRGVMIVGAVSGSMLAMYGHSIDKDLVKGLGYGFLLGDALVGVSIYAERYLQHYFNKKAQTQRSKNDANNY